MSSISIYLGEFSNPTVVSDDKGFVSGPELSSYPHRLEAMRLAFVDDLLVLPHEKQSTILTELRNAVDATRKRHFFDQDNRNLLALASVNKEHANLLMQRKVIDDTLINSGETILTQFRCKRNPEGQEGLIIPGEPIEEVAPKQESDKDTGWYTVDEVCEKYKLPKNNVKDRKWREKVGFPTHQSGGAYSCVRFNAKEVEEWLTKH